MIIKPSKEEFKKAAAGANLVPVYAEILADLETPVSAFMKLAGDGDGYLLESVEGGSRVGRYSFLGFAPEEVARVKGRTLTVDGPAGRRTVESDQPLKSLLDMVGGRRLPEGMELPPFCGGAVGYIAYDAVRYFEKIPDTHPEDMDIPEAVFMFANRYLVFDRVTHRLLVAANAKPDGDPSAAYDRAVREVEEAVAALRRPVPAQAPAGDGAAPPRSSVSEADYARAVDRALEHIRRGDILQVVLSLRFEAPLGADPFGVYRALRALNPSPYMFYLRMGDLHLAGSSPEIMVKVEGSRVTMNPIAGTRPRGRNPAEDAAMEKDLAADVKEGAEHLMLVDLGRNDLGRVCLPGTVSVPSFRRVERFSHVMHLVSTVEGDLVPGTDRHDVIRAVFPAGTVSGAPKIRAMEIIDDLETTRRGPYAGLVGYFDYRGSMDSCITIRTVMVKDGRCYVQTGAGIVADSKPEREYQECRQKAEALFRAIELARGGEL